MTSHRCGNWLLGSVGLIHITWDVNSQNCDRRRLLMGSGAPNTGRRSPQQVGDGYVSPQSKWDMGVICP